jgi:hypothetical protein
MTIISETLIDTETHPGDNTVKTVTGSRYRGDGFYNRGDGLHTVQWSITSFTGSIFMQATLSPEPTEADWFTVNLGNNNTFSVDTTGLSSQTTIKKISYATPTTTTVSYNFVGNYVWVRACVSEWTSGTINSVMMSH